MKTIPSVIIEIKIYMNLRIIWGCIIENLVYFLNYYKLSTFKVFIQKYLHEKIICDAKSNMNGLIYS